MFPSLPVKYYDFNIFGGGGNNRNNRDRRRDDDDDDDEPRDPRDRRRREEQRGREQDRKNAESIDRQMQRGGYRRSEEQDRRNAQQGKPRLPRMPRTPRGKEDLERDDEAESGYQPLNRHNDDYYTHETQDFRCPNCGETNGHSGWCPYAD